MRQVRTTRGIRPGQAGAAMIEAALVLAMATPLIFAAVRLGYGVDQVHSLQAAATAGAKTAARCENDAAIRAAALAELPGLKADQIRIERFGEPGRRRVRVAVEGFPVMRLQGAEPLEGPIEAVFPNPCE